MKRWLIYLLVLTLTLPCKSLALVDFKKGTILRDAEIERTLKSYIEPIFKTAGLDPKALQFYLIYDPELNAFATTRYTIVLHSGLVQKARNVEEVIGVLAHETGHIAGGHIARIEAVMKKTAILSMAAAALGILAGVTTGRGDLGGALIMGGMNSSFGNMLHYSRGQEASADQAAIRFLDSLSWPAAGLLTFMEVLNQQELLTTQSQEPYFRTHPLSSDRITFLKNSIKPVSATFKFPHGFKKSFGIIKAKLDGYLNPPGQTILKYSEKDPSFEARYARAIAFYRDNQTEKSLQLLNGLLQEDPHNAYVSELKGQILFENGRIDESVRALRSAHSNAPGEPLIKIMLAQSLLETQKHSELPECLKLLKEACKAEEDNPLPWHLLALVYGRQKNLGMAALCLAEEAFRVNKYKLAREQARRALIHLKEPQPVLRAKDLIRHAEEEMKLGDNVPEEN